jgi:hypothetical protein
MGYWNRPDTLSWFEPRWSFVPRYRREFGAVLRPAPWLRIGVAAIPLAALLVWGIRQVPGVELSWAKAARMTLLSGAALAGMFALLCGLHLLIPPAVRLSRKGVSRQTGQVVLWLKAADLRSITLDRSEPTRARLRIESTRKTVEIGVGSKVAPDRLVEFLKRTYPGVTLHALP